MEWRTCLYALIVFERQNGGGNKYDVTAEEKRTVIDAYNLPNAKYDPRIRLAYISCLAALVSNTSRERMSTLSYNARTFYSLDEAVHFIRDEAE